MDALNRQEQSRDHNSASRDHQSAAAYSQFPNQSNAAPNDEFNTFFNVPGDDGANQSFNTSWDTSSIIDPRLQQQSFGQHANAWNQSPLSGINHTPNSGQGLVSTEYQNAFAQNNNSYFPGYQSQFTHYQGGTFSPGIGYGSGSMLNNHNYPGINPQSFGNQTLSGQTIAPSALQSYPNLYGHGDRQTYSQSPSLGPRTNSGLSGTLSGSQGRRKADESSIISAFNAVPAEQVVGDIHVKPSKALSEATESEKFNAFVFIGKETFDSDDPKGVLPKIVQRKSLKEMKCTVLENQGNSPFDARIRPALKKLKLSAKTQRSQPTTVAVREAASPPSSDEETSSSEDESDGSDYENAAAATEVSPLPSNRPKDPIKAIEYDVIKVIWFKRKAYMSVDAIRNALGSYWNLIKPVRDSWKVQITSMNEAEAKKDKVKMEHHKSVASGHRRILDAAVQATVQHGHPDVISKLSENANLFLSFYQLLVDRFKETDFNGTTVTGILKLMVRCTSLSQSLLEKTKLDKVLLKLVKRGNETTKKLVQSVNDLVSSNTEKDTVRVKDKTDKQDIKDIRNSQGGSALVNGVNRPRETDAVATKKTQSTGSLKAGSTSVSKATTPAKSAVGVNKSGMVRTEAKSLETTSAQPNLALKTKFAVPKPTSILTGLLSASKKPGTSIASQKSAQTSESNKGKTTEVKKSAPAPVVPKAAFSFSDTLANLDKPRESGTIKTLTEDRPPESEEDKKRRLRKEARRHLRVKWKPEASLVETRLFRHDPEEEVGHDQSMIRDATDVKEEGQMLKLHKDLELGDEEEAMEEMELAPWHGLSGIDFDSLPELAKSDNFEKYGGKRESQSTERVIQRQRELTTLIAIYPSLSDIPYTPREPGDPFSGTPSTETLFGIGIDENWQKCKRREEAFFASRVSNTFHASFAASSSTAPTTDINALLKILGGQQQPQIPQQTQQPIGSFAPLPMPQNSGLESIFAQFKTPQPQAVVPQASMVDPSYQSVIDIFKQQQQQPQYQPAPVYQPPPTVPQQTADLSALLAQFSQQTSNPQQTGYNYQPNYYNENDRKRPFDDSENQSSEQYGESKRSKAKKVSQIQIKRAYSHANAVQFTGVPRVPCKFWQEGKCRKGSECTFLHT